MTFEEFKQQAKHGDVFECDFNNCHSVGRVSINEDGRIFLCQNEKDGFTADNKLGYWYSWATDCGLDWAEVFNFRFINNKDGYAYYSQPTTIIKNIKQNKMNISTIAKRIFDKDTKTLIKAGFLKEDLSLTEHGKEALDSLFFSDKKDELVKLAQEELDEKKEECCK